MVPTASRIIRLPLGLLLCGLMALPAAARPDKAALEQVLTTLERATRSGDFDARAMAVAALGHGPKKRVSKIIGEALTDPQWKVRRAAIDALASLRDKRGWSKAVIGAMGDLKVDVALGVMPILEPLGPKKGVKLIIKALKSKDFPHPERWADALAKRGGAWMVMGYRAGLKLKGPAGAAFEANLPELPLPDAAPLYAKGMKRYPSAVQERILARVAKMPELKTVSFIKPLLKSKDSKVAFKAAAVLAARGDGSGKAILVEAAKGADPEKQLTALQALGGIASKDLFDLCRPITKDRKASFELLKAAYTIFFRGGSKKLKRHLEKKLANTDINHRAVAVHFIGDVKGRAALDDLLPLLGAGPLVIRREAAIAVGRLAMREGIPALRDALMTAREKELRLALLHALAEIKDIEIIPVVRFYITDNDVDVRRAALEALITVPHESAVGDLEIALRDRDKGLRTMALRALLSFDPGRHYDVYERALDWIPPSFVTELAVKHDEAAKRYVRAALKASRAPIRAAAFEALKGFDKAFQLEVAGELLERSKRPEQRLEALELIVALSGKAAKERLEVLTKDADVKIRIAALSALGRLGVKESRQLLLDTTLDPAEAIRVAAAAALIQMK